MNKSNFPLIIMLILVILLGAFAGKFYKEKEAVLAEKKKVTSELKDAKEGYKKAVEEKDAKEKELVAVKDEISRVSSRLEKSEQAYRSESAKVKELRDEKRDLLDQLAQAKSEAENSKKQKSSDSVSAMPFTSSSSSDSVPSYWEDVVKEKAEYKAYIEKLDKQIVEAKMKINTLDKENKELSIKVDQLTKVKQRLEDDISFKNRTIAILSKDLVNQKENNQLLTVEVNNLRDSNISLKQELIVSNDEKNMLQDKIKDSNAENQQLSTRVESIEKILKEKDYVFRQLKSELSDALEPTIEQKAAAASAVELPPIVVGGEQAAPCPAAIAQQMAPVSLAAKGMVIAVNNKENFVVIDIGQDDGIVAGTKLTVLHNGKQVGVIEVIEVRKEISAADIKSVLPGETLKESDQVVSQ